MGHHYLSACLAVALVATACRAVPEPPDTSRIVAGTVGASELRADIAWLAAEAREGRGTGSAGFDSAAAFVVRRYVALGVPPAIDGYLQEFMVTAPLNPNGSELVLPSKNVVAMVRGRDDSLAGEYVVVGAHLDHIGRNPLLSNDAGNGRSVRNGADDNASGTVAVIELARRLHRAPARRSVIIVHFGAEEVGLFGSAYFVGRSPVPIEKVQAMVNLDMVGRLKGSALTISGVETAAELRGIVDTALAGSSLDAEVINPPMEGSDHESFIEVGIPAVLFHTGTHANYHRASDDVERIDADGLLQVIGVAERTVRALADRPGPLTRFEPTLPSPPRKP